MKNFLLLCFLLLAGSTKIQAQPYPSIFGRDSTVWYVFADNYDGGIPYYPPTVIYTVKNDTAINGVTYKKVFARTTHPTVHITYLGIREDLGTGKVWTRNFEGPHIVERLLMDFSLNVGDTFRIDPNSLYQAMVVDSVYQDTQNRKHIVFDRRAIYTSSLNPLGRRVEFITGIGNNWGLRYNYCAVMNCGINEIGLICAYKDREKIYKDTASVFKNDCIYPLSLTDPEKEKSTFQIAPNPVTEHLSVSLPVGALSAVIYNVAGQKMWALSGATQTLKIDCSQWPPGLYVIRLQDKSGSVSSQTFLKQ